jgi:hypothetical protein
MCSVSATKPRRERTRSSTRNIRRCRRNNSNQTIQISTTTKTRMDRTTRKHIQGKYLVLLLIRGKNMAMSRSIRTTVGPNNSRRFNRWGILEAPDRIGHSKQTLLDRHNYRRSTLRLVAVSTARQALPPRADLTGLAIRVTCLLLHHWVLQVSSLNRCEVPHRNQGGPALKLGQGRQWDAVKHRWVVDKRHRAWAEEHRKEWVEANHRVWDEVRRLQVQWAEAKLHKVA